jgi:hypothetical protein
MVKRAGVRFGFGSLSKRKNATKKEIRFLDLKIQNASVGPQIRQNTRVKF